ncbi:acid-activated periplasmic chaperone HdeB [Citrobacter sedlakii]|uniref:acid-activated periplasmic chaperone HdeB n=1 Tax=Citrobacter sedlakii TaxID=67826 RepID=UPI000FAE20CA|nr:acid-activated periplasmic chaperone HdeB [Citrobacter sedlakii]EFM0751971.1 acid-activated periplasmic chaperone HdeB [Salmonella enterica subsp. enterica serovar Bredeney]EHS1318634.1 acid-activated periplasmic chaperone HdeB [Salmonella enterica subsp. enterica serovar Reading]MJU56279.1 acid-activated periplasmic chaperone HdeB [Salmonella enterica subsp. enterica serovar Montevideo]MCZ4677022.1 acid-activated periplasmic chaperone HdeB [Citrobacter sedlakii]MDR5007079.1 acid-activated 
MKIRIPHLVTVAIIPLCLSANVYANTDKVTPDNMLCEEFIDLNPATMAPVAFWVFNEQENFKGGDYITFQETETTAVPLTLELCKKAPNSKLSTLKDEVKKIIRK